MAVKAKKPGRALRVADQIARDIAELIPQNVRDPRVGLVTITGCEITPDYAHAKLFFHHRVRRGKVPRGSECGRGDVKKPHL